MISIFLLFMVVCDANDLHCQIVNGGYYDTKAACEIARVARREEFTDAQCKRVKADPD